MGGHGFSIDLHPDFKKMVAKSNLTQKMVNNAINNYGRDFLDSCGFDTMTDPDETPYERLERSWRDYPDREPGPNAYKLYEPSCIKVSCGEWGPEHISVPGNACGLDIDRKSMWIPNGATLYPHNVNSWDQKKLLLMTFCYLVETAYIFSLKI